MSRQSGANHRHRDDLGLPTSTFAFLAWLGHEPWHSWIKITAFVVIVAVVLARPAENWLLALLSKLLP